MVFLIRRAILHAASNMSQLYDLYEWWRADARIARHAIPERYPMPDALAGGALTSQPALQGGQEPH